MDPPLKPFALKNKGLDRAFRVFSGGVVACWFVYGSLLMSWTGHRPVDPNPATGNVFVYYDKERIYVTAQDLQATHVILGFAIAFALVGWVIYLIDRHQSRRTS